MKIFCYTKDTKVARRSLNSIPEKLACISQNIRVGIIAMSYLFDDGRNSSVSRALDCRVGGRGFDSRGWSNTQSLK